LCGATDAIVRRVDGDVLRLWAHYGPIMLASAGDEIRLTPGWPIARAVIDRRTIHIHDVADPRVLDEYPGVRAVAQEVGFRTLIAVPLMREDTAIGVILIRRMEVRPFTDKQITLLQTFADQAVIAIENVRLFKELQARNADLSEALDRQTATAEILKVISSSPADPQPVFDAIAMNAARLCSADDAQVLRVEGNLLRLVASFGTPSMPTVRPMTRGNLVGRAVIERKTVHFRDLSQALAEYSETTAYQLGGPRALAVPLMREGGALGVIRISRTEIRPYTDKQIALVETFADQAVIAIENVRLFTELEARNRDLTDALARMS